ncbi:T9SS type A sorting domain-containing protein [Subsaximicrobium wynnwilliamsii]|uniref:T9SS type A sorting domain-containing protein n=1 Tax=Subsaximicrobium wynnwilliamsii TaxID=291179 RepID=A0A5C6ZLG4_9FLAO|nr:aryl-sulfate sulfotransferase [Subsaximicrobium wynnwilliamsii]TXD85353.1 T9SS type A sorting domain-containing protein [Subsaximicrobium wynnwilliamsii]TXD90705.1 T9SS type A sorting domain-containing protein [Subsaximicrobium wynnwilliamsii]TXE05213.1 T9SS type A sorting domain-containing protein [Subsaximicrobium wynnwilliamsii]
MKKLVLILFAVISGSAISQETVGLVFNEINENKSEGYTLFKPSSDNRAFLIDNCGEVVNQWNFFGEGSRNCYFLEDGTLLQSNDLYAELRDWDNNVLWSIDYEALLGFRIHHDIEPLPNGNFLVLVRDGYTNNEMFAEGMDTSYPNDVLLLERILEIEPVGTNSANIVWEWKLFDHLVQDFDSTKPNYGIVADNVQLLDMNYDGGHGSNPIHANAIDYNEDLDQIAVSARHLSEVFIIDHSTTTAEAATHSGGIYGKGGDFLWRWGNPEVYDMGTIDNKKLGRQHDIKWITEGPNQGKMSVFSNDGYGSNLTASSVHIIDQNDTNGFYSLNSGKFLPEDYFWSWNGTIMNEVMHAGAQCGVQIMSNGNALINESDNGRLSEIDNSGNVVWVYIIPAGNNSEFDQFTEPIGNGSFRAHRYSESFSGFENISLNSSSGIIENINSISENCSQSLSLVKNDLVNLTYYPNPTKDYLYFSSYKKIDKIEVFGLSGNIIITRSNVDFINLKSLANGMYLINILHDTKSRFIKVLKE